MLQTRGEERDLRTWAAKVKVRYTRGTAWLNFLTNFGIITANIWIFQKWIPSWFPVAWAYWAALGLYLIACYAIGHFDEVHGIWTLENQYGVRVSPQTQETLKKLNMIDAKISKMETIMGIETNDWR